MKKLLTAISILLEQLKSFIFAALVGIAIVITTCSIVHNVLKIREIYQQDRTGYKNLVSVGASRLNVRTAGYGDQTVVILPDLGDSSPIIKYKRYSENLPNYKAITIEFFGYGFSLSSKTERSNVQFANEIKNALDGVGATGPYIFVTTGTSCLYAYTYANLYPEDVQKLVVIDGYYPKCLNDEYAKKKVNDFTTNSAFTTFAELSGYARILSYVSPETFHIDQMKKMGFSSNDIKTYRTMIANRYYTASMRKEVKMFKTNMEQLSGYVYPEYLPVTQVLSSGYVKEVNDAIKDKLTKKTLEEYANELITNPSIQTVVTIDGEKSNLSLDNPLEVVPIIMN